MHDKKEKSLRIPPFKRPWHESAYPIPERFRIAPSAFVSTIVVKQPYQRIIPLTVMI